MNHLFHNQSATVGGSVLSCLSVITGWINTASAWESVQIAAIGAITAFIVNTALNWIKKKISK